MPKKRLFLMGLVFPALVWAAPSLVKLAATTHAKALLRAKKATVAVLLFSYKDGKVSSGSAMLSEQMGADMTGFPGVRVADRKIVRKKLFNSTVVETMAPGLDTIKKMGSVLEVDAVLSGTMKDLEKNQVELTTHLYRTDTSKEISTAKSVITRTWTDEAKFPDPAVP